MAIVVKAFRDRVTKRLYKPGDIYEGSLERINELSNNPRGAYVEPEATVEPEGSKKAKK